MKNSILMAMLICVFGLFVGCGGNGSSGGGTALPVNPEKSEAFWSDRSKNEISSIDEESIGVLSIAKSILQEEAISTGRVSNKSTQEASVTIWKVEISSAGCDIPQNQDEIGFVSYKIFYFESGNSYLAVVKIPVRKNDSGFITYLFGQAEIVTSGEPNDSPVKEYELTLEFTDILSQEIASGVVHVRSKNNLAAVHGIAVPEHNIELSWSEGVIVVNLPYIEETKSLSTTIFVYADEEFLAINDGVSYTIDVSKTKSKQQVMLTPRDFDGSVPTTETVFDIVSPNGDPLSGGRINGENHLFAKLLCGDGNEFTAEIDTYKAQFSMSIPDYLECDPYLTISLLIGADFATDIVPGSTKDKATIILPFALPEIKKAEISVGSNANQFVLEVNAESEYSSYAGSSLHLCAGSGLETIYTSGENDSVMELIVSISGDAKSITYRLTDQLFVIQGEAIIPTQNNDPFREYPDYSMFTDVAKGDNGWLIAGHNKNDNERLSAILKIDRDSGSVLWHRSFDGSYPRITAAASEEYVAIGTKSEGTSSTIVALGLNEYGSERFYNEIDLPNMTESAYEIQRLNSDAFGVMGWMNHNENGYDQNALLLTISSGGEYIRHRSMGEKGYRNEYGRGVIATDDGGYITVVERAKNDGRYKVTFTKKSSESKTVFNIDYCPSLYSRVNVYKVIPLSDGSVLAVGSIYFTDTKIRSALILKVTPNGEVSFVYYYPYTQQDRAASAVEKSNKNIVVAVYGASSTGFIVLSPDGDLIDAKMFELESQTNRAGDIILDQDENILVVGSRYIAEEWSSYLMYVDEEGNSLW